VVLGGIWGAILALRVPCEYNVDEVRNWPHIIDITQFPIQPLCLPDVPEILENQVQDLVPVKGVEVRVLSSAFTAGADCSAAQRGSSGAVAPGCL